MIYSGFFDVCIPLNALGKVQPPQADPPRQTISLGFCVLSGQAKMIFNPR